MIKLPRIPKSECNAPKHRAVSFLSQKHVVQLIQVCVLLNVAATPDVIPTNDI